MKFPCYGTFYLCTANFKKNDTNQFTNGWESQNTW